jgi:dihydrofolate reductase
MTDIQVFMSGSLDGVMQAPARPDEDTRGGFSRGGWATKYADPVMWEGMGRAGSLLFGRRTYEDFTGVWPKRNDNPFTPVLKGRDGDVPDPTSFVSSVAPILTSTAPNPGLRSRTPFQRSP